MPNRSLRSAAASFVVDAVALLAFVALAAVIVFFFSGCGGDVQGTSGDSTASSGSTEPTDGSVQATGYCLADEDPNSNLDPLVEQPGWCVEGTVCVAAGACIPLCGSDADCDLWPGYMAKCESSLAYPDYPRHCQIYCDEINQGCPFLDGFMMTCGFKTCSVTPKDP